MGKSLEVLQHIGWLFREVNVSFREGIDDALAKRKVELTFSQISTLSILDTRSGINGAQLARHNLVSPQAMTAVLRQLVAEKLIERRDHPESLRADSWHLTPLGMKALERGRAAFAEVTERMLCTFTMKEVAQLEALLSGCALALRKESGRKQ